MGLEKRKDRPGGSDQIIGKRTSKGRPFGPTPARTVEERGLNCRGKFARAKWNEVDSDARGEARRGVRRAVVSERTKLNSFFFIRAQTHDPSTRVSAMRCRAVLSNERSR